MAIYTVYPTDSPVELAKQLVDGFLQKTPLRLILSAIDQHLTSTNMLIIRVLLFLYLPMTPFAWLNRFVLVSR